MDTILSNCRICKSSNLKEVVNLGNQYLASRFPFEHEKSDVPVAPVILTMCNDCSLVQLKNTISQPDMYEHNYGYKSSISNTMRNHLKQYNSEVQSFVSIEENDWVLDIGCNDGTFLKYYGICNKVGCDPTGKQFQSYYSDIHLIPNYFTYGNVREVFKTEKFKIVTSIAMFYDLPDPIQFATDIHNLLDDDGIWSFEQSYALSMVEKNSLDTICHEHLEYYNIKNILDILSASNFKCIDLSFNDSNGGSMRFKVAKKDSKFEELNLNKFLENEKHLYITQTYIDWFEKCTEEINKTKKFIKNCKSTGANIFIYGASTKGNTLLQYANLDCSLLDYAVERNPDKLNRYTPGTNIPIILEEEMRRSPPKYMLVLPWHFKDEIIKRESEYLENGGTLIFPLPKFETVTKKNAFL
jgi:SAM-dependent methyltransferase